MIWQDYQPGRFISTTKMLVVVLLLTSLLSIEGLGTTTEAIRNIPVPFGVKGSFKSLSCNDVYSACLPFNLTDFDLSKTATISCGTCRILDITDGSTIEFRGGLDIQGKLIIPGDAHVKIRAPIVLVQGELEYIYTEPIISPANIKVRFEVYGNAELNFTPHSENNETCRDDNAGACEAGKKAIVVAGGKVTIDAWPDKSCPTWTNLMDVVELPPLATTNYPKPVAVPDGCEAKIINHKFETGRGFWRASPGTTLVHVPGSSTTANNVTYTTSGHIKSTNRMRPYQGPFIDLGTVLGECIVPDKDYIFSARVRLSRQGGGQPSRCFQMGENCLKLRLQAMDVEDELHFRHLAVDTAESVQYIPDGVWRTIHGNFTFSEREISDNATYNKITFVGPEAGIDISVDDVVVSLPNIASYHVPTVLNGLGPTVCHELLRNGDASANLDINSPYPWTKSNVKGTEIFVMNDGDGPRGTPNDPYFRAAGRRADWASIQQQINQDCIQRYALYKFSVNLRLHSTEHVRSRLSVKTYDADPLAASPYKTSTLGWCQYANVTTGWFSCEGALMFGPEHQYASKMEIIVVSENNADTDIDYDDFKAWFHAGPVGSLLVPKETLKCWGTGSDIIVTSHTLSMYDTELLYIKNITLSEDGKFAEIKLPELIRKHTTVKDHPDYAIEVALLTRNMQFLADRDDDPGYPKHGGHIKFFHTPNVAQTLIGVEVLGYGQLRSLGRYPIHLHMNQNVIGTKISYNTVRDSNQRCYVVHDTHNATFEYNVAFNTSGHCFVVEDGGEEDNVFYRNLGACTKAVADNELVSITESDHQASTFWTSAPKNIFRENVCAGSADTGFWYEMLEHVRGPSELFYIGVNPSQEPLGIFDGNIVHSNGGDGFKLYPNGHFPKTVAVFRNTKAFRNKGDGVLFHNSKSLAIEGGIYADNRQQIEIDKQADDIRISNAIVEGYSDLYRLEVLAQKTASHCPAYRPLVGIQLHSFLRYRDSRGYLLENVEFKNFGAWLGCANSTAMDVDPEIRDDPPHYDAYTVFRNLTFQEGSLSSELLNICGISANGVIDLAIQDSTGDLNPTGDGRPGFMVSDDPLMTTFPPECYPMKGACAQYCPDTCFRGINFAIPAAEEWRDLKAEVLDIDTGKKSNFFTYWENVTDCDGTLGDGQIANATLNPGCFEVEYDNTIYQRRRYITPIMPDGNYTITFKKGGEPTWPQSVEYFWEDKPPYCDSIDDSKIHVNIPAPPTGFCDQMVQNNGAEEGTYNLWTHSGGGLKVVQPGTGGANSFALSSTKRVGVFNGPAQFIDTRCLVEGSEYEILAKVRLVDEISNQYVACNPSKPGTEDPAACPRASIRTRKQSGYVIGDYINTTYMYPVGETVHPLTSDPINGWNILHGAFTVNKAIGDADSVLLFFERGRTGLNIVLDDVTVSPKTRNCNMPVYNTDLEVGDTRFWYAFGDVNYDMLNFGAGGSSWSITTVGRSNYWSSMAQDLNVKCLKLGDAYQMHAMIHLYTKTTSNVRVPFTCDPIVSWSGEGNGNNACPAMAIKVTLGNRTDIFDYGKVVGAWDAAGFNRIVGDFVITQEMIDAERVSVFFRKFKYGVDIAVDDLFVGEGTAWNCTSLTKNGDAEVGDNRFWNSFGGAFVDVSPQGRTGQYALRGSQRVSIGSGLGQVISPRCLASAGDDSFFYVKAYLKLVDKISGAKYICDPKSVNESTRCPVAVIAAQNPGGSPFRHLIASMKSDGFDDNGWNVIEGSFKFSMSELNADVTMLAFEGGPLAYDILVDDVTLVKLS